MTVPANSITRISLQYRVPSVDCITSFHLRNDIALSNDAWRDDILAAGPVMMNQLRRAQSIKVTYTGAVARVLDHPEIPSVAFTAQAVGQALTDPLPAVNYCQLDLYATAAPASGRRARNAMRISGIANGFWYDDCLDDALETQWLNAIRALAGTDFYVGNAAYIWVIAYHPIQMTPPVAHTWGFISAVNSRFSARVLSSRQR